MLIHAERQGWIAVTELGLHHLHRRASAALRAKRTCAEPRARGREQLTAGMWGAYTASMTPLSIGASKRGNSLARCPVSTMFLAMLA